MDGQNATVVALADFDGLILGRLFRSTVIDSVYINRTISYREVYYRLVATATVTKNRSV